MDICFDQFQTYGCFGIVETYQEDPETRDSLWYDEEEKKTVLDFLKCCICFLFIEYGEMERARELFTRLLDNLDSYKFAREVLDYLDSLDASRK